MFHLKAILLLLKISKPCVYHNSKSIFINIYFLLSIKNPNIFNQTTFNINFIKKPAFKLAFYKIRTR